MRVRQFAALSLTACLSGCVFPDLGRGNSRVNNARLEGRTQAEVLAELGLPTALTADGRAFLYALFDNDWWFVVPIFYYAGFWFPLNPHLDVRFVSFDQRGFVEVATEKSERRTSLDKLVQELTVGSWRRR